MHAITGGFDNWAAPLLSETLPERRQRLNPHLVARFYQRVEVGLDFGLALAPNVIWSPVRNSGNLC